MNKKIILTLLIVVPLGLSAQTMSLRECIDYGLKNNRNRFIYANEKKAADSKAKEVLAAYLPGVSLTGALDDNLKVQQTIIPAGVFGPDDVKVAFTKQFNTNGTAQLDQKIYDQSLLVALKANNYSRQQAELNLQQSEETIIYNISNAYYQIFVYREQLALLESNLVNYHRQMEVMALQVSKGVTLSKDLDKVTVDYNNALSQKIVAGSNLTLSENQLKYEMGYPIRDSITVDGTAVNNMMHVITTNVFSLNTRIDYQLSQVNAKMLEIDQRRIKAGMFPTLTAYARYGAVGFGDNLGQSFSTMNTFSAIGLKLSIPILDFYKRNAQYNQAKYKYLNAQEQLKLDEGKYELQYENAKNKMLKEQVNVENNKRNIELAQSVFQVTNLQYEKGTTDLTDWLNAQHAIKEAQNNYLNALYSFLQARIDLEKANGTLKTFYSGL